MNSLKLKKIVATVVAAMTIATICPVGASAAWKQDSNGWWNTEGNSYSTGWRSIDNTWYYFDSTGYMKTGWANDNGTWYYLQPSGAMKTGWVIDNGTWYHLQPSGAMSTGWVNDKGTWYFTSVSGAMQTGIVEIDGKIYCLAPSGAMQTGNILINGKLYTFAASGEAVGEKPTPDKKFTGAGASIAIDKPSDTGTTTGGTSGGSSGGGGGSSSSTTEAQRINNAFSSAAEVNVVKNADNTWKVNFKDSSELKTLGYDYVTRDLYVTNADGTNKGITVEKASDGDGYTVTSDSGQIKVNGVVRVVSNGKVYYVTK